MAGGRNGNAELADFSCRAITGDPLKPNGGSYVFVHELKTRFALPKAIALDRAGNLYVGCSGQGGIRKFVPADTAQRFASAWSVQRNKDGYGVLGLAVNRSGNIVATVRNQDES